MPSTKPTLQLGDSWVVEEEAEDEKDEDYEPEDEDSLPARKMTSSRKISPPPVLNKSPEPELVMPSISIDSLDGPWAETTGRASKVRDSRFATDGRRRSARPGKSNGSPLPRKTRTHGGETAPSQPLPESNIIHDILGTVVEHATTIMSWFFDILGEALKVLKKPLSYFLAVWLLFGLLVIARNLVTNSIYASLSPICRLPGTGLLNLPFCPVHRIDTRNGDLPSVEFDQLMTVQAKFEEVLEESAGGVSLPLDMKRGEASIRDLRQLVRYSQLQSKNELVLEFDGFIETARIASYDLQRFNSHVGRAVDSVISTTRWTTKVLDGIQERDASRGSINAFINDRLLAPFQPVKFTESILLDQYIQHTRLVEEEIFKLILEAQALLSVLNNIEDRLDIIHGIATREDIHARTLRGEVLSELWTLVGGNKSKISKMDRQLNLLKQVGIYRKTAFTHVSGTIIRLQGIAAGLEDLRERVGSPELLRDRIDIPLSVHIENIQKGVERLEDVRQSARKAEDDQIRKTLERGQLEGTLIDG